MSEPTAKDINDKLKVLISRINIYGDEPLTDTQRKSLSAALAYTTAIIRGKYELKSDVYFFAECKALELAKKTYGDDFLT